MAARPGNAHDLACMMFIILTHQQSTTCSGHTHNYVGDGARVTDIDPSFSLHYYYNTNPDRERARLHVYLTSTGILLRYTTELPYQQDGCIYNTVLFMQEKDSSRSI